MPQNGLVDARRADRASIGTGCWRISRGKGTVIAHIGS